MRERMNELNGKLEMESDGHGTTMRAIVPLFAMSRPAENQTNREDCASGQLAALESASSLDRR